MNLSLLATRNKFLLFIYSFLPAIIKIIIVVVIDGKAAIIESMLFVMFYLL
jgi:hypothetical protein